MSVKIKDKDTGMKALMATIRRPMPKAAVGILGSEAARAHAGDEGVVRVVEVAAFHEFGLGNNPERSFIRATHDEKRKNIAKAMRSAASAILPPGFGSLKGSRKKPKKAVKHMTPDVAMARVGLFVEGLIKRRIAAGIGPALKAATIRRKGSSKPLIDTGQLRNAVTSEVRK